MPRLYRMLAVVLVLAACFQQPDAPPMASATPAIALLLIGPKDDHSWGAAAYAALQVEAAKGTKTAFSESVSETDAAKIMRGYIDQGFKIIIAHSFGYEDAVFAVAKEHPEVNFAWAGGIGRTEKNVADYDQPFYEAAYLMGILAGHVSPSGRLGALYGFDIPVCHAIGEAMLAGARTVNPLAQLAVSAVDDWRDVAKAKAEAIEQVKRADVDFWISCGEGPTLGAIAAAKEQGGFATGYGGDMSSLGPDVVLASMVWNMTPLFTAIAQETTDGSFQGTFYRFGVKEGALAIILNPALRAKVPQAALEALDKARTAIERGALRVPFVPK